jgi:hypothetical protein
MKPPIIISLFLLQTINSFSQDTTLKKMKSFFDDTTLIRIDLIDTFKKEDRIIVDFWREAVIYLSENDIREAAVKDTAIDYDYLKESSKLVIRLLDSCIKSDTIFLKDYPPYFTRLVSDQIKKGNVKIFDKKNKLFIPFVYHRLERVISTANRVYYFSDHRRFFQVREWSGILPNEIMEIE